MKRHLLTFLVVAAIAGAPPAWACSCIAPGLPEKSFGDAKAVFTARVAEMKKNSEGYLVSITLKVDKVWKGNPGGNVPVTRLGRACGFWPYEDGESYLIYADASWDESRPDDLHISTCSRTKLLAQGHIETQYLDALAAGIGVTHIDKSLPNLLLTAKDPAMRVEAARLLGEMLRGLENTAPDGALESLVKATQDKSAEVRIAAARTLGSFHKKPGVKEALLVLLREGDPAVRNAGAIAVSRAAGRDSAVFRALADTLATMRKTGPTGDAKQYESSLSNFADALAETQGSAADKAELVETLSSMIVEVSNESGKVGVIQRLGFQRQAARKAAPLLLYALRVADSDHVRQYTIRALADIGAIEAQSEIERYLDNEDCYVAGNTIEAVHKLNPAGFQVFFEQKALAEVKTRFDTCAFQFLMTLQAIGKDAKAAEPFIAEKYAATAPTDFNRERLKALLEVFGREQKRP